MVCLYRGFFRVFYIVLVLLLCLFFGFCFCFCVCLCVVVCFGGVFFVFDKTYIVGFLLLFVVIYLFIYLRKGGGGGVDVGYVLACYFFPFVCMSLLVFNL